MHDEGDTAARDPQVRQTIDECYVSKLRADLFHQDSHKIYELLQNLRFWQEIYHRESVEFWENLEYIINLPEAGMLYKSQPAGNLNND
jgi:hypothetical protein